MRPVSISPKDVIDVDSHVYEPKSANQTPWLPELGLSTSDIGTFFTHQLVG